RVAHRREVWTDAPPPAARPATRPPPVPPPSCRTIHWRTGGPPARSSPPALLPGPRWDPRCPRCSGRVVGSPASHAWCGSSRKGPASRTATLVHVRPVEHGRLPVRLPRHEHEPSTGNGILHRQLLTRPE